MSQNIYPGAHPQGVEFVGLLLQNNAGGPPTNEECEGWTISHETEYPILRDPTFSVAEAVGQTGTIGLPLTFILDANANVRFVQSGGLEQSYMIDLLNDILETPYGPE